MASAITDMTRKVGPNRRHVKLIRDVVIPQATVERFRDGYGGFFYLRIASVPRDIDSKLSAATIEALEAIGIELRGYVDTGRIVVARCDESCYHSE